MRKSELCRGVKGNVAKNEKVRRYLSSCHTVFCATRIMRLAKSTRASHASLFSQCVFFCSNEIQTCSRPLQSSRFVQNRAGELREHSTGSQAVQNQQDSVFPLLKGKRGRREERDSHRNIFPFPVKLDFLDVQMRIKGNLKRGNPFPTATNP